MARIGEQPRTTVYISANNNIRSHQAEMFDICIKISGIVTPVANPFSLNESKPIDYDLTPVDNTETVHSAETYPKFNRTIGGAPAVIRIISNCFNRGPTYKFGGTTTIINNAPSASRQTVNMGAEKTQEEKEEEERKKYGVISLVTSFIFTIILGKFVCDLENSWSTKNEFKHFKKNLNISYSNVGEQKNLYLDNMIKGTENMIKRKFIRDIFRTTLAISGLFFSVITLTGAYYNSRFMRKTGGFGLVGVILTGTFQASVSYFGKMDSRDRQVILKAAHSLKNSQ